MKTPFQRWLDRWLVPAILATVGLPFVIAGATIFALVPSSANHTAQQIRDTPLATLATLPDPGETVMLQGTISDRTPARHETLVAYRISERRVSGGETTWQLWRGEDPTLWVDLSDGMVQIEAGYLLVGHSRIIQINPNRSYNGIQVGDEVFMVGTLTTPATDTAPPLITTTTVNFGSQEDYLQSLDNSQVVFRWMGVGFLAAGAGLVLGSGVAVFYTLRPTSSDL